MKLRDKIIIVTGGNGLLGKDLVKYLLDSGAKVVNAELEVLEDIDDDLISCDVTSKNSVKRLIEIVLDKYGHIDGLVNNAYPRTLDWGNKFEDILLESWKSNVDMQLNSAFYISQLVLEVMKKFKNGSIVNIASIYGVVGNDFTIYDNTDGMTSPAAYSAIKGGIINLTRYLASYYGEYGIRVNCVSPGGIFNHQNPQFIKQFEKKVPLKRMAKPSDISPSIGFLLSDEATYITGHNLIVDGGWTAI
ncbi:MAG: SDR family oxidoreductase [Sediminibacterium sp.]